MRPPLTPQLFSLLTSMIEARCGMHYDLVDAPIVGAKIASRAAERDFDSLLDYYYYLRYDDGGDRELDALVETMLVQETYFFREYAQLQALVDAVIRPLIARAGVARIWCAACASGEEPLSLAMMLARAGLIDRVHLVASDASAPALERARSGVFRPRSVRSLVAGYEGWLKLEDGRVTVAAELVARIAWQRVNLLDDDAIAALGSFDVILCKNVLIYFRDETTSVVLRRLTARLAPKGTLVVGVSESLLRFGTALRFEEKNGAFFYEKASD